MYKMNTIAINEIKLEAVFWMDVVVFILQSKICPTYFYSNWCLLTNLKLITMGLKCLGRYLIMLQIINLKWFRATLF